jgi:hypothetical protein
MSVRAYPLQWPKGWPRTPTFERESSARFQRVTLAGALNGLQNEVRLLGGADLILSSNYTLGNTNPKECGVVAHFTYEKRQVAIPCDRWDKIEGNVRAIALTIEAMRGMERWGAKSMIAAMFQGFTALNERTGKSHWDVLGLKPEPQPTEKQIMDAYRKLAQTAHPDKGGSSEAFSRLGNAKDTALASIK